MSNKNDFKPFAVSENANVLSQENYELLAALGSGFTAGVAKSAELNKVWRQSSIIAAVIAQFMCETLNVDIIDDGNVSALKTKLITALQQISPPPPDATTTQKGVVQLLNDLVNNKADELKATTSKGVNELINSIITSPLGTAAYRAIGTGANQVPDMSSFASTLAANGVQYLPSGLIIQWDVVSVTGGGTPQQFQLKVPFPNAGLIPLAQRASNGANAAINASISATQITLQSYHTGSLPELVSYIAIGY